MARGPWLTSWRRGSAFDRALRVRRWRVDVIHRVGRAPAVCGHHACSRRDQISCTAGSMLNARAPPHAMQHSLHSLPWALYLGEAARGRAAKHCQTGAGCCCCCCAGARAPSAAWGRGSRPAARQPRRRRGQPPLGVACPLLGSPARTESPDHQPEQTQTMC